MTNQDQEATKIDFAPKSRVETTSSMQDGGSQFSKKQQRKIMKQRSICSPRRLLNSPPPKQTPPIPSEDLSPSPRRVSIVSSTPLYFIKTPPPPPATDQRPVTPCMAMARPVLMKMATITSPTGTRLEAFCILFCLNFIKPKTLLPWKFFRPFVCFNLVKTGQTS